MAGSPAQSLVSIFEKYPENNWVFRVFPCNSYGVIGDEVQEADWAANEISVTVQSNGAVVLTAPDRGGGGGGWALGMQHTGGYVTDGIVIENIAAGDDGSYGESRIALVGTSFSGACVESGLEQGITVDFSSCPGGGQVTHIMLKYAHGGT